MQLSDTIRAAAVAAAVRELTAALLRRYGPTMSSTDLAGLLGISASGLRMRRQRGADLPPALGEVNAIGWSTATIALWLVGVTPADQGASPATRERRGAEAEAPSA